MGAQEAYVENRSPSNARGSLFANARSRANTIQTSSSGFAHAEHRSIIHTFYASTSSRLSPFPAPIGGQQSSGGTRRRFTISASYFRRMSERQPLLLLWVHDIGSNESVLCRESPHLPLRLKIW